MSRLAHEQSFDGPISGRCWEMTPIGGDAKVVDVNSAERDGRRDPFWTTTPIRSTGLEPAGGVALHALVEAVADASGERILIPAVEEVGVHRVGVS